jgi:hypothetical protein
MGGSRHTLQPSLQSVLNILPFLFTDMLSVRDMYRLMCSSKEFSWVAREYITQYIQHRLIPRISLYVEGNMVPFNGFGIGSDTSHTTLMFQLREPRYLQTMPGKHEIRCEIAVGTDAREISTIKSLLFHDFSTGLKSYTVLSPISLFSSRWIHLTWEDQIGTDDDVGVDVNLVEPMTLLSPPKKRITSPHRTTYAGTMGFHWYTKLFRYLTRWRDKRRLINSIPCITHITIDVPDKFLSPSKNPITTAELIGSFAIFTVSNTLIHSALLGVGYWFLAMLYWVDRNTPSISQSNV